MSRALAVFHGRFGRATVYQLNRPFNVHAHREGHLIFHVGGTPAQIDVCDQRHVLTDETVVAVNDQRKRAMAGKVAAALGGVVRGKIVAVVGLTFKPNTDDMREAPSIALITALQDMGAKVKAYDPVGMEQAKAVLPDVIYCDSVYSSAENADALVIVTEWEQFRALDIARLKQAMARPVLVDLRNIYRADELRKHGFYYQGVGKPIMAGEGGAQFAEPQRSSSSIA